MHWSVVMFFPLPWVSFWKSDTMSRRGSLILQEHWSDPLCCVLLFFSVATPESVAWRMWVSSCALTAKKEFAAGADQTSPTRLGTRQARSQRHTNALCAWEELLSEEDGWKIGGSCEIFWVCSCVFFLTPPSDLWGFWFFFVLTCHILYGRTLLALLKKNRKASTLNCTCWTH